MSLVSPNFIERFLSGITLVEFAQMEPPNHDMHPMRVLIKIQKSDSPTFDNPRKWYVSVHVLEREFFCRAAEIRATCNLSHIVLFVVADRPVPPL